MFRSSWWALAVLAAAIVPAHAAERTEAAVRAATEAERVAILGRDTVAIERLFADDLLVNSPGNRVHDKAEVLARLRTPGLIDYTVFERTVERVAIRGDIATVMGSEVVVDRIGPRTGRRVERRFTDMLRYEGGEWRMFARHANVVPPATPPR